MIWIVLAAGLGVANCIVLALLFRRLRGDLNRQLRDMRAERNSELILHALRGVPDLQQPAVRAANGTGTELVPPPGGTHPVRRKKHLGLYLGGGLAAMVVTAAQAVRKSWKTHPIQLAGAAVGVATLAAVAVVLLTYTPWQNHPRPPSSAPTAPPTTNPPPVGTEPPTAGPSRTPSVSPSSGANRLVTPYGTTGPSPAPTASGGVSALPSGGQNPAEPGPQPPHGPPPADTGPGPSSGDTPPPAGTTPPPVPPPPPAEPEPTQSSGSSGLCVDVAAMPVVGLIVCLLGGG
jgi:hypothetical protein